MKRTRRQIFAFITVVGSLLLGLAGLEGGLRVYYRVKRTMAERALPPLPQRCVIPSRDPELIFELNPGWADESFRVNSLGMADEEVAQRKPPGVFRIAFVGDSITCNFGHRPREEIYLTLLQGMLNARARPGVRVQCLNFGVNGYGITQSLHVARTRASEFEADLLVAQLGLNDPYPCDELYGPHAPTFPLQTRDLLFRLLRPQRFWGYSFVDRRYDREGLRRIDAGIADFGELNRNGTPVLMVLFPYLYRPAYEGWGFGKYHQRFAAEAETAGVALLDLRAAFDEAGLIDDRWPKDPIHPDAKGHRVAATAIFENLTRMDLFHDVIASAPEQGSPAAPIVKPTARR